MIFFILIIILILIIVNIINNKKIYRGGLLDSTDINIINSLIEKNLIDHNLIDHNLEDSTPSVIIAKASILLKQQKKFPSDPEPSPILGDSFFHIVQITDANRLQWEEFRSNLEEIMPSSFKSFKYLRDNRDFSTVHIESGFGYFDITTTHNHDIYVAYASILQNNSINPPNWQDVECMVSILGKKNVPFYSPVGIFVLPHTYPKTSHNSIIENINRFGKSKILINYLKSLKPQYPSHKNIALMLLTFAGKFIQNFYKDSKTALFTSPTDDMTSIIRHGLDKYKLPYGIENNDFQFKEKGDKMKFDIFYDTEHIVTEFLSSEKLFKLCPWYCNQRFNSIILDENGKETDIDIEDTENCYSMIRTNKMVYIPIESIVKLFDIFKFVQI